MAEKKNSLYRWERFSKPRVYSRSQKITTKNDIQDWIKKVEDASGRAAATVFDRPYSGDGNVVQEKMENVRVHDAAYSEAQELLEQWMEEKLDLDEEEPWMTGRGRKSGSEIKREWDELLADNDPDYTPDSEPVTSLIPASERSKAFYSRVLDDEDGDLEDIIGAMMKKDVVGDHVTRDLGIHDNHNKQRDPVTKMAVRHQQVKENREKREAEKKRKFEAAQAQKDARIQAKKIIQKEETEREVKRKKEEAEIGREMARIRKEMAEERRRAEEKKHMERKERERREAVAEEELGRLRVVEEEARRVVETEEVERRRQITEKLEEAARRNLKQRLTLLGKYFGGWYSVVAKRRVEAGRARAMADWRLLLRTWRAWRKYHHAQRGTDDAHRHMMRLRQEQRNVLRACEHHRLATLHRCLAAWLLYTHVTRGQKEIQTQQRATQSKMAAFLQAAAAGAVCPRDDAMRKSASMENIAQDSARLQVDEIFSQPTRWRRGSLSARNMSSTVTTERSEKTERRRPTQAWQVTRRDLKLSKQEISNLTRPQDQGEGEGSLTSQGQLTEGSSSRPEKSPKKPWEKKYVVNTTEHRTAAQAKILEQQQQQIKEQQRLITELTYLQKQQLLQTQLTQQQLLRQQQSGSAPESPDLPKLEAHIQDLQRQLIAQGGVVMAEGGVANGEVGGVSEEGGVSPGRRATNETARSDTEVTSELSVTNIKKRDSALSRDTADVQTDRTMTTSGGSMTNRTTSTTTNSTTSKHHNFLKAMEGRAAERARLKAEREEKKRRADQERLARLAAEAEEERKKDEEEKRKKAEEYRDKKRQEREREAEKQQQAARLRQQHDQAAAHHLHALIKYRGWLPWRRLVDIMRNRTVVADTHYRQQLLRRVLSAWSSTVREEVEEKEGLADQMCKYILTRRCFNNWQRVGECVAIQEEKAQRFFMSRLVARVFMLWRDLTEDEKIATWHRERAAREHNLKRLKKGAFHALRSFPAFRRAHEEKEKRRAEMRKKVASLLPDYDAKPPTPRHSTASLTDFPTK